MCLRRGFSKLSSTSRKIKSLDSARPVEEKEDPKCVLNKTKRSSDNKPTSSSKNSRAISSSKNKKNVRESRSKTSSNDRNKRECRSKSNSKVRGSEEAIKSFTLNNNAKKTNSSGSEDSKRKVNQKQSKHNPHVCHKTQKLFEHNKVVSSSKKKEAEHDSNLKSVNNYGSEQKDNPEDISKVDKNSYKVFDIKTNPENMETENIKIAKEKEKGHSSDMSIQTQRIEDTSSSKDDNESAITINGKLENESSEIEEQCKKMPLDKEHKCIEKNGRKSVKDNINKDLCRGNKEKDENFENNTPSDRDQQNVIINKKDFGSNTNHQRCATQKDSRSDGYQQKSKDDFQNNRHHENENNVVISQSEGDQTKDKMKIESHSDKDYINKKSTDNSQNDKDQPKNTTKDISQTDQKHQKEKNKKDSRTDKDQQNENKDDSLSDGAHQEKKKNDVSQSDGAHQEKKKNDVSQSDRDSQNKKTKDNSSGDREQEKNMKDFQDGREWRKEKSKDSCQTDKEQQKGEMKDTFQSERNQKNKKHKDDSQSNKLQECEKVWSKSEKDLNIKNKNALQNFKEQQEEKKKNSFQNSKNCYKEDKKKDDCKSKSNQQKEKNKDVPLSEKDHQHKNNPDASRSDKDHQNKKMDNFQSDKEQKNKNKGNSQSCTDKQKQKSKDAYQHHTDHHTRKTRNNPVGNKEPIKEMCRKDPQDGRNQQKEKSKDNAQNETDKKDTTNKDAPQSNKDKKKENIYSHNDKEYRKEKIKNASQNFQEQKSKDCSQIIPDWHKESKKKDNCRSDKDQQKKSDVHLLEKKSKDGCGNDREREKGKNSKDSPRSNKNQQSEQDKKINFSNKSVKREFGNSREGSGCNTKHSDRDRSMKYLKPNQVTYTSRRTRSSSQKRKKQNYSSEQLRSSQNRSLSFDGVSRFHVKNERCVGDYTDMQKLSGKREYSQKDYPVKKKRSKSPLTLYKPDERSTDCNRIRRRSSSQSNKCFSLVSSDDFQFERNGSKTPDMSMEYSRSDSLWKLEKQEFDTSSYHENESSGLKSGREELSCTDPPFSSFKDIFYHSKNEVIPDRSEGLNETSFSDKFMETSDGEWRMLPERDTVQLSQREKQSEEWRDGHGFRLEKTEDSSSLSVWKEELENSDKRTIRTTGTPKESNVSTKDNWQVFCSKRTNELLKEGIKPDCYDFEGEWMELIKRRRNEQCLFSRFGACSSIEQFDNVMPMKLIQNEMLDSSKMISDEGNNLCSIDDKKYLCNESLGHQRIVMWQSTNQKKQNSGRKRSIEVDESSLPEKRYVRESHLLPSINNSKPSHPGFSEKNVSNYGSSTFPEWTTFPAPERPEDDLQLKLLKAFNQNSFSHNNLPGNVFNEDYKESIANQVASVLTKLGMTNISESVLTNVLQQLGYLQGSSTVTSACSEANKDSSSFFRTTSHSDWQRNIPFENDQGIFLVHRIGEALSNLGIQLSADTMQTQVDQTCMNSGPGSFPQPFVLSSFDKSLPMSTTIVPSYCTNKPFKSEVPKGVPKTKSKFKPKYKQRQWWKRKGRRNTFIHTNFQKLGTKTSQNDNQTGSLRAREMKNTKQIAQEKSLYATNLRSTINQGQVTSRMNDIKRHSEVMVSSKFKENQKNQMQNMYNPFEQERSTLAKCLENESYHIESSSPGPSTKFHQYNVPLGDDKTTAQNVYFQQKGNIGNSVPFKNDIPCQPYFNPWIKPNTIIGPGNNNFKNMTGQYVESKETNIQSGCGWNSQILKTGESLFSQNKSLSQTTPNTWAMPVLPFQNLGHHFTSQNSQYSQHMAPFSEKLMNPMRTPGPHQITANLPPPFPSTSQDSSMNALSNINYTATSSFMPKIWKKF
ncbi:microtubule-associated protein futsch-like [Limulus polyphemus]|uniref:Microtubule-associated protein futsch-like n=1 Tax=Limulus polyphemus TaxID=6850 RepID=A0ABM1TDI4_LIMPO|nr:microtubule-associated protein futsch-like [Limulus polyphemus]XP_022253940.1 microtubule-associated protein futsch-like [Limulus polyphemus]